MSTETLFQTIYTEIIQEFATKHIDDVTGRDFAKGQNAEDNFAEIAVQNGCKWTQGSDTDDRIHHVDGILTSSTKRLKIEIKSSKSERCPNDVLIEFRGGSGHSGWLYGKADFIAHEVLSPHYSFVLFSKPELIKYAEAKCNIKWDWDIKKGRYLKFDSSMLTNYSCEAIAPKIYNRNTDQSIITRININELKRNILHSVMFPKSV